MQRTVSALAGFVGLIFVLLVSFGATSFAAGLLDPIALSDDASVLDLLRPVYDAFAGHHSIAAGALAIVALLALAKRYAPGKAGAFLHGDVGGTLTVFGVAFFGSVAAATADATSWDWAILGPAGKTALAIGVAAIGGYTVIRKLVVDRIVASEWYKTAPGWIKAVLALVSGNKTDPVVEASKAGAAAVAAAPSTGVAGVAGPAEKF